jgi:hypothetical protein
LGSALVLYLEPREVTSERLPYYWFAAIGLFAFTLGMYGLAKAPISFFMWVSLIHAFIVGALVTILLFTSQTKAVTIHWQGPRLPEFIGFFVGILALWFLSPLCLIYCLVRQRALPKGTYGRAALISNAWLLSASALFLWEILSHVTIMP